MPRKLATVCAGASSTTLWSAPGVNVGASLTSLTTTVKVRWVVTAPPSETLTVITALPDVLATGV